MEEVLKDERFSHILTDPRFRKIPKNVRKIKVDNRFKNLFKSKNFKEKCRVDERGRSLNLDPSENLQNLYNLDEEANECLEKDENLCVNDRKKEKKSHKTLKGKKGNIETNLSENVEKGLSSNDTNNQKSAVKGKKANKKNSKKQDNSSHNLHSIKGEHVDPVKKESLKVDLKKNVSESDNLNQISKQKKVLNKNSKTKTEYDARFIFKKESDEEYQSTSSEEDTLKDEKYTLKKIKSDEVAESEESEEEDSEESEEESELSSSEEESDDSESEDSTSDKSESFDHQWEEQHERAPDADEITRRLAVCNMDWDRIRAEDLYVVFNSFKPADTSVLSVKIYPSEFGLKRMEEEKLKGPPELVEKTLDPDEEEDDEIEDKKGGRYNREKLRQYQMNRLKYYYAIVECDTPETANSLYEQLNGMEYESSSVRFDLRFVPDDTTFDVEPTSTANNVPDLSEYKPRLFVTTALQQVKVGLTWDETDPHRRETLQKAFTEPDTIENDIKDYLASSSGESEDEIADEENSGVKLSSKERIQKFRELLESINKQEKEKDKDKYEMEITWEPGVKEKTETLVKEKLEEKTYTPFEELQKKKKEKQKLKKKEKKAKTNEEEEKNSQSDESDLDISQETENKGEKLVSKKSDELYLISDARKLDEDSQKSKKKKKKKVKENNEDIKVDINDPRFSAIYTSPLFNIDPSDPHFKDTPGNLAIIAEKQRRLKNKATSQDGSNKRFKYN